MMNLKRKPYDFKQLYFVIRQRDFAKQYHHVRIMIAIHLCIYIYICIYIFKRACVLRCPMLAWACLFKMPQACFCFQMQAFASKTKQTQANTCLRCPKPAFASRCGVLLANQAKASKTNQTQTKTSTNKQEQATPSKAKQNQAKPSRN